MAAPIFDSSDMERNKVKGSLGYILPFAPHFLCKDSAYGRYCANQGLIIWICLFILSAAFGLVGGLLGWLPLIGRMANWLLSITSSIVRGVLGCLMVYYTIVGIATGRASEVPFIGSITLLK